MKEFIITQKDDGRRLDKWLTAAAPSLPVGLRMKYLRLKRVKVNGAPGKPDTRLLKGDCVRVYLEDAYFEAPKREDPFLSRIRPQLNILFENEHILIVDKRPGLVAHPDEHEKVHTLITEIQAYLYQKGQYDPADRQAFAPALVNRIDRFTGGIVLCAKTKEAADVLLQKIRDRQIEKRYLCVIHGRMARPTGMLRVYLEKTGKGVKVWDQPAADRQEALTSYGTLQSRGGLSLMECELLTGRTHQIRASFAHAGHPLLGDDQYGESRRNEPYGRHYQALYAYKIAFHFEGDAGVLAPLNGMSWQVKEVRFVEEYFPSKNSAPSNRGEGKKRAPRGVDR